MSETLLMIFCWIGVSLLLLLQYKYIRTKCVACTYINMTLNINHKPPSSNAHSGYKQMFTHTDVVSVEWFIDKTESNKNDIWRGIFENILYSFLIPSSFSIPFPISWTSLFYIDSLAIEMFSSQTKKSSFATWIYGE